mmetsp:Transcript_938/g.1652  ORF Transcript_938/g.1652 Transcript_938/m.1652 type:complete len:277 (-) Transcript_938:206-1036(-)
MPHEVKLPLPSMIASHIQQLVAFGLLQAPVNPFTEPLPLHWLNPVTVPHNAKLFHCLVEYHVLINLRPARDGKVPRVGLARVHPRLRQCGQHVGVVGRLQARRAVDRRACADDYEKLRIVLLLSLHPLLAVEPVVDLRFATRVAESAAARSILERHEVCQNYRALRTQSPGEVNGHPATPVRRASVTKAGHGADICRLRQYDEVAALRVPSQRHRADDSVGVWVSRNYGAPPGGSHKGQQQRPKPHSIRCLLRNLYSKGQQPLRVPAAYGFARVCR